MGFPEAFGGKGSPPFRGIGLVGKDEMMEALWPDTFVEESNLVFQISQLRKALGEGPDGRPYVKTVARRGYRFTARVTESETIWGLCAKVSGRAVKQRISSNGGSQPSGATRSILAPDSVQERSKGRKDKNRDSQKAPGQTG